MLEQSSPPLLHYMAVVRRGAWLIVAVVAIAVGTAAFVSNYVQQSVYRASMKIVVGQGGGVFQPQYGSQVQPFTLTMTNLLQSDIVASTVIDNLQLKTTPRQLLSDLSVTSRTESSVLELAYDSPSKEQAVVVLSEIGSVFASLVDQRLGSGAEGNVAGQAPLVPITASVFDPAHLQPGVVSPRPKRTVLIAGILGLVIGLVLVFARDALDDRIRGRRDAEDSFGAPVVGELPKERGRGMLASRDRPAPRDPAVIEALYRLRANLQFSQGGISGPVLVVTSAVMDDSHSIVSANVAVSLAMAGADVICVEADMRRPQLERALGVTVGPLGLVDVLERRVDLDTVLEAVPLGKPIDLHIDPRRPVRVEKGSNGSSAEQDEASRTVHGRLRILPVGKVPSNPADVLTQDRTIDLLDMLRSRAQYVVIDTPPLLRFGDAFPVLSHADNVVVVARDGEVTRGIADSVRTTLDGLGVQKVSIVLTHSDVASRGSAYRAVRDFGPTDVMPDRPQRVRQTV